MLAPQITSVLCLAKRALKKVMTGGGTLKREDRRGTVQYLGFQCYEMILRGGQIIGRGGLSWSCYRSRSRAVRAVHREIDLKLIV